MSHQQSHSYLHPSVLSKLKPYVAEASEYWRFPFYVDELERKYLHRDLLLEEKVKFLLALISLGLSATARAHLADEEFRFLEEHAYTMPPASQGGDSTFHFWAPLQQAYFDYPVIQGPGVYPELTFAFYKKLVLQFVSGDDGADNCLTSLTSLKQENIDLRVHIGEFTNLLDRYCQLAGLDNQAAASLSLFTDYFYQSLNPELRAAITVFPQNLHEAFRVATDASRTSKKRKALSARSAPPSSQALKRSPTASVNAVRQTCTDNSVANLAQYLESTKSNSEFIRTVADVCSLTPNVSNIANASELEVSGLRAGIADILGASPSYRHACNAIQNLTPSKFVKKTSSTRSEEAHYENLDELSTKQLKMLYKKRKLIDSLRSRTGDLDTLSSDDEEEEEKKPRPNTRSRRTKENVAVFEHDCNIAFMQECFEHVDLCSAERLCSKCNKPGHFFRSCPELKNADGSFNPFCAFCKGAHAIQTCTKLLAIICSKCNSKGHTARFCPSNACAKCSGPHHTSRCRQ
jgi:hypothetical protein